jgi:hypothetical protein
MQAIETQITAPVINETPAPAITPTGRAITTAKGNTVGTKYVFELGDTKSLKEKIKSSHPDWGNKRISREVAVLRADKMAASRLQADWFIGLQYQQGNVALVANHRDSGKSSLHFESVKAAFEFTPAVDETAILKAAAMKLADKLGCTIEEAAAMLK